MIGVFAFWAAASFLAIAALVLPFDFSAGSAREGFRSDAIADLGFVNWASLASTAVSAALVVFGLLRLWEGDRPGAYLWLTRALLVSIFITRVFTFVESQFGAVFGLAIDVLLLVTIQLMAQQERRRQPALVPAPNRPAGESAAPALG